MPYILRTPCSHCLCLTVCADPPLLPEVTALYTDPVSVQRHTLHSGLGRRILGPLHTVFLLSVHRCVVLRPEVTLCTVWCAADHRLATHSSVGSWVYRAPPTKQNCLVLSSHRRISPQCYTLQYCTVLATARICTVWCAADHRLATHSSVGSWVYRAPPTKQTA